MNTTSLTCTSLDIESLSDSELYQKCKDFGLQTRIWRRKFAGLLPEVAKRELHKKRGFSSIYEFAGKLSGMSHETTGKILRIAIKVEDKPALKNLLISGDQGWSKIEKVAWIATKETDGKWAEKVKNMPQQALEVFVQEFRNNQESGQNSTTDNNFTLKSKDAEHLENMASEGYKQYNEDKWPTLSFAVNPEVEFELRLLKQKIEKDKGEAITWSEFMEEVVNKCKNKIKSKTINKNSIAHLNSEIDTTIKTTNNSEINDKQNFKNKSLTRNIPIQIKREVLRKYNRKCAYPNCNIPPDIFHHTERFALDPTHGVNSIVPICKKHERLAHTGEIINENLQNGTWQTGELSHKEELNKTLDGKNKLSIDSKVHMYRKE